MSIKIIFIEKFSDSQKDESLVISKQVNHTGHTRFLVEYIPSSKHSKQRQTFVYDTLEEVYRYMNALSNLVAIDRDPLHGVQIFIPGFPSIMIDSSDLGSIYIQNCLAEAFSHWHESS